MKRFVVSSFDDLHKALIHEGPRTINFVRTGNCEAGLVLESPTREDVLVGKGDLLIDARYTPVPVQFLGFELNIKRTSNVIIRNVYLRRGATGFSAPKNKDDRHANAGEALAIIKSQNVLLENCTLAWGTDECVSITDSQNVVLYKCLVGAPLDRPRDENGDWLHYERHAHGYGLLVNGSDSVYIDKCLFVHCRRRTPSISGEGKYTARTCVHNNLVYNYGEQAIHFNTGGGDWKGKTAQLSFEHNIFIRGENTEGKPIIVEKPPQKGRKVKLYSKLNHFDSGKKAKPKIKKDSPNKGKLKKKNKYRIDPYDANVYTKEEILDKVGAFPRDDVDRAVILDVELGMGEFIDHEQDLLEYTSFK